MHIPDGYLSPQTCAGLYAAAAPFWYVALRRMRLVLDSEVVPLIGLLSAFCFVLMMFNIPLPGGTTGHAVGMGVAAIVLGPWASILAISTALVIQALLFGDGGITTLGANCFNMAIVGSLTAYACYRLLAGRSEITSRRRVIAAAAAGYVAINAAAFCAAIEFGIQPVFFHDPNGTPLYCPYPLSIALPAMMIGHLTFAGLTELILTAGIVAYLQKADPGLLMPKAGVAVEREFSLRPTRQLRRFWIALAILVVLTPLGILAVGSAWGEWSASDFADPAARQEMSRTVGGSAIPRQIPDGIARLSRIWRAPMARYAPEFAKNASSGYLLSSAAGVGAIVLMTLLGSRFMRWMATRRGRLSRGFIERTLHTFFVALERSLFAEELARSRGILQRFDPRTKLAGMAVLSVVIVSARHIPVLVALLALLLLLAALSGAPFRLLLKTVWLPAFFFSGLVLLPTVFITPGSALVRVPWFHWAISQQGVKNLALLLLRVEATATLGALLIFTTEWARLLRALRFFRLPVTAVVILGFAYRYLFLLLRTAQEMFESRRSRLVGELDSRERRLVAAASAGALLSRTFTLSAEVHAAMRARGFQGEVYLLDDSVLTPRDYASLSGLIAIALLAFVLGR